MKYQNKINSTAKDRTLDFQLVGNAEVAVLSPKPYEAPELISYGDVRDITLGGTFGFGESGAGFSLFEPD